MSQDGWLAEHLDLFRIATEKSSPKNQRKTRRRAINRRKPKSPCSMTEKGQNTIVTLDLQTFL